MATRKKPEPSIVLLVRDKNELKQTIETKIALGNEIFDRDINTPEEKQQLWRDFQNWDVINEEIIRQAFDNPQNMYVKDYKYVEPIDIEVFYGVSKQRTFQEEVDRDKSSYRYQVTKLKQFYDKIDFLQSSANVIVSEPTRAKFQSLILMLNRFHKIAQAIRERHDNRDTIIIRDEYDVQDLLRGLLQIYFDDIRPEDYSPSHAGANSRIDFVLKNEKIVVETKMTNEKITTNQLGKDLLFDIGRYKSHPDCNDLVIFIYDKGDFISNKNGFKNDLQSQSTPKMKVTIVINPA